MLAEGILSGMLTGAEAQGRPSRPSPTDLPARSTVDKLHLLPHTTFIPTALAHGIEFAPASGDPASTAYEVRMSDWKCRLLC